MTPAALRHIEQTLKVVLPEYYRQTLLDYPFPADSFAAELTLPTEIDAILLNNTRFPPEDQRFVVGSDGGEEVYFILPGESPERVYVHQLETSNDPSLVYAHSWAEFLRILTEQEAEIRQDELATEQRKRDTKWWQFWI